MFKNRHPISQRGKVRKLSKAHAEYLKPGQASDQDIIEDTKEIYAFLTHTLLGAYIEPDRDKERWVRRCMRDALAAGTLRRIRSREIVWNAQHKNNAFDWLLNYWLRFDFTKTPDGAAHRLGDRVVHVDYDVPVIPNV